jgi:glucose-6-phosphate isomerase
LSLALAIGWRLSSNCWPAPAPWINTSSRHAPADNLPLTLALLSLWNTDFLGASTAAVLPYSQSLSLLPAYLQQLEMESNGKQVDRDGDPVGARPARCSGARPAPTASIPSTNCSIRAAASSLRLSLALREADFPLPGHHISLLANCLAQSAALAFGQTADEVRAPPGVPEALVPYKIFPGNQPSSTLVLPALTPYTLGQLLALFEHKVFCLGVLWNLNSFDQWGVELGKQLASQLTPLLAGEGDDASFDASTRGLIAALTNP